MSFVDTSLARTETHVLHPATRASGKRNILVFQVLWYKIPEKRVANDFGVAILVCDIMFFCKIKEWGSTPFQLGLCGN